MSRLLYCLAAAICLPSSGCMDTRLSCRSVEEQLERFAKSPEIQEFAMAQAAPFAWEKMFAFNGYDPIGLIQENTGLRYESASRVSLPNGHTLVVFTPFDSTKCAFEISKRETQRVGWQFAGTGNWKEGIARSDARFSIDRSTEVARFFLIPPE